MSARGFRFRAQAALDLRRREDDEAHRALARAEAALIEARRGLADVEQRAIAAREQCAEVMRRAGGTPEQWWYQSWIIRLDRERSASASIVEAREKQQQQALVARARTHQRVRALERFKEKLTQAWERHRATEDQKYLDALATIRFGTSRRAAQTEVTIDAPRAITPVEADRTRVTVGSRSWR